MMTLIVNGIEYENFEDASCEIRLDALCRQFSFSASAIDGQPLPFKGGESCLVKVDGELVLTGNIEAIDVSYSQNEHDIQISGRSKTADLLDSNISVIDSFSGANLTLKKIIEIVIANIGSDLKVIDRVGPSVFSSAEDLPNPEPGDNAFSFIEKYARKRQILLTDDEQGNVVIASNSGTAAEGAIQNIIGASDNNVLSCNFSFDSTDRYNVYEFVSSLNPSALNSAGETDLLTISNQSGRALDVGIREGRQLYLESESPFSSAQCVKRAQWEANIRKARGLTYSSDVPFFRVGGESGALWNVNQLYLIKDDFIGKSEQMLSNSVKFSYSAEEGSYTSIGFLSPSAYTQFVTDSAEVATNIVAPTNAKNSAVLNLINANSIDAFLTDQ